jgi:hypothetical protein
MAKLYHSRTGWQSPNFSVLKTAGGQQSHPKPETAEELLRIAVQ